MNLVEWMVENGGQASVTEVDNALRTGFISPMLEEYSGNKPLSNPFLSPDVQEAQKFMISGDIFLKHKGETLDSIIYAVTDNANNKG